ncbi:PIG-L family deacetylase [Amycolatopsis sp. WAC 04169]|uniref:PIG-L deacetylase family protein n=1 Tax=Amycolatopsis sp. WAC 04169 TaxID=2203197 RepID=UPI000F7784A2|nr:PIG-L family deacetylase [Amycolatopsis sp. WAC 04169]RSN30396.1 PIG-L family deacetylase [Amycolatopsis sp. WAC 04169]
MTRDLGADRILAISPHLDDAVLSFGAGLAQAERDGAKVTVHTVFAGTATPPFSPAADRLHSIWGLSPDEDASLRRRDEDIAALGHLGAEYRHSRFLDAIYRKAADGRWMADNVPGRQKLAIGRLSSQADPLFSAVQEEIASVVQECDPTLILTCAAASGHIDNEITRDATLLVAREREIPVRLWEDLPHAMFAQGEAELPEGFRLGAPEFASVEADARARKFEALLRYPTQMRMLHGPDKDLFAQLDGHAGKNGVRSGYGETTWPVVSR